MLLELALAGAALALLRKRTASPLSSSKDSVDSALDKVADQQIELPAGTDSTNLAKATSGAVAGILGALGYGGVTTGTTALPTSFTGTGIAAVVINTAVMLIPVAILLAGISATGVFLLLALFVFAAVEIVDTVVAMASVDANQKAALQYLEAKWADVYRQTMQALAAQNPDVPMKLLQRVATPFADGFVMQSNRLAYLRRLKGEGSLSSGINIFSFGTTSQAILDAYTRIGAGNGRGEFYGRVPTVLNQMPTADSLYNDWVPHCERPDYLTNVVPSEDIRVDSFAGFTFTDLFGTTYKLPPRTTPYDAKAREYQEAGKWYSNAAHYGTWMKSPWGIGMGEAGHTLWGLNHGEFEGSFIPGPFSFQSLQGGAVLNISGPDGHLTFKGRECYWRDPWGKVNVFARRA